MPLTNVQSFGQDSNKAGYVAVPQGSIATIYNVGNTLYYKSTSDVTSSSNDGSLATATTGVFTKGVFLITAAGVSTNVTVRVSDGVAELNTPLPAAGWSSVVPSTATSGTDTAFANGTTFITSIFVPATSLVTNVGFLLGSVGGTDKVIATIWDANGNPVANTTTAASGTTAGTAANTQSIALTTPTTLPGPAVYFVGIAANGATAKLRTVAAFTGGGTLGNSAAITHGTIAFNAPPTSFTADKAPFVFLT